ENAGCYHRGSMDQGRYWRGAFHGIRKPRVEQKLRRLAHRSHEQEEADQGERIDVLPEEMDGLANQARRLRKDSSEVDRTRHHENCENAKREAEVPDAVDDECLDGGSVGLRL